MGQARRYKYKDIQLPQLRSFCLAATEGSFSAAAALLGHSVSAVWQQVRALEGTLGAALLRRRGRRVELTAAGRLLLELAQPHVSGLDSLPRVFGARQAGLSDPLTVVATAQLLVYHLPELVGRFTHDHPEARIHLRAGRWQEILDLVERGEADMGLTPWDRATPRRPGLEYDVLFDQPLLLLTSSDHPLRRKRTLRTRDLAHHPLIVQTPDTCDHQTLLRLLRQDDLALEQLQVALVSPTVDMTLRYVALGVGIALAHVDPATCRLVPGVHGRIFDPKLERLSFALVLRKNAHRSPLAEAFRAAVRRMPPGD